MHIWTLNNWETILNTTVTRRTGLRLRFDKSVDPEVRHACLRFAKWLRKEYYFPLRINIYIKSKRSLITVDGDSAVGTFFEPLSYADEPYIRIATGDYIDLVRTNGRDNALASILFSISHELSHYFQWINNLPLTPLGRERQASRYAVFIVDEYSTTCDHP